MTGAPEPTASGVTRTRDGRRLAWQSWGDPAGAVVVSCHGGLSCGRDVASAHDAAHGLGVRIVAPDRPGVGGSDHQPGRTLLGWADDVADLLDDLEVATAAALGWSAGGQYALALGHALAPRIARVAVVAGAVPLTWPGAMAELNRMDRRLVRWSSNRPALARTWLASARTGARRAPTLTAAQMRRALGPADAAVLAARGGAEVMVADLAEGLCNLDGAVEEYRVLGAPWGFGPEDVPVSVALWQGGADRLVPPAWADRLAARLPDALVRHVPDAGHLVARTRWDDVLAWCRSGEELDAMDAAAPRIRSLTGVYHADGGVRGELAYVVGKALGRAHCALCDITHGAVSEKAVWRTCRDGLAVPFAAVHRNERSPEVRAATEGWTPSVVAHTDAGIVRLVGPEALEACGGDPAALVAVIEAAVEANALRWP